MKFKKLEKYPLVSVLVYGALLFFTVHHLKEHMHRLNKNEDSEFIKFLLIIVIIISIYESFNTGKEIVESSKDAVHKIDTSVKDIKHKSNSHDNKTTYEQIYEEK